MDVDVNEIEDLGDLIATKEAARILGVTVGTMADWRWRGKGPQYVRLGERCIRYSKKALRDYIEANTCQSTSQYEGCRDRGGAS